MRSSLLFALLAAVAAVGLGVLLLPQDGDQQSETDASLLDASLVDAGLADQASEGVRSAPGDDGLRARAHDEPRVIELEPLGRRGALPARVQVAKAADWRRAEEAGDVDLIPLIDPRHDAAHQEVAEPGVDLRAEDLPTDPLPGTSGEVPPPGPPVLRAFDGDLLLRMLDEALGGRIPLRFESAAALETYRLKRLHHPVPAEHVGAADLIGYSTEMLGYRAVAADGALYFRPAKPGEFHGEVPR